VEVEREDGTPTRLTDREILGFASLLAGAGAETVANLLGNAAVIFADHPEQWRESPHRPAAATRSALLPGGVRLHAPGVDERLPGRRLTRALVRAAFPVPLHRLVRFGNAQRVLGSVMRPAGRPQPEVGPLGANPFAFALGTPLGGYPVDDRFRRHVVRLGVSPPIEPHRVSPLLSLVLWAHATRRGVITGGRSRLAVRPFQTGADARPPGGCGCKRRAENIALDW
jgi:hypothetical protein